MSAAHHVTNDPYLASYLLSEGAALADCRRVAAKRVEFRFAADRRLHDLLRLYWSGEPVPLVPSHLMAALRKLKSRSFVGH